jgi:hypothetical protein
MVATSHFGSESIMSNELISMYIAMVAEDQKVNMVLCELLHSEGAGFNLGAISMPINAT